MAHRRKKLRLRTVPHLGFGQSRVDLAGLVLQPFDHLANNDVDGHEDAKSQNQQNTDRCKQVALQQLTELQ